jgi:hypothetical protein
MPIIAVAVAIGVSVAAGSAVAAVGLTVVTALEVVAAVGATLAAVGAVTRDKTLTLAGTVIGAIGGIGGLAAGAGLLGADAASNAPLFGPAPSAATADAASADTIGSVTGAAEDLPTPPIPPDGAPPAPDAVSPATAGADQVATTVPKGAPLAPQDAATVQAQQALVPEGSNAVGLSTSTSGNVQEVDGLGNTVPSTAATANAVQNPELGGSTGFSPGGASQSIPPSQGFLNNLTGNTVTGDPASNALGIKTPADPSTFGKLAAFADAHPTVAFGALQAGSSLLQGLTSTLTPAQVSALQAQAAANDAAAALTNQQRANLAQPKAVATSTPVTGTPAQLVPTQPAGFINQPKLAPVTGVPA